MLDITICLWTRIHGNGIVMVAREDFFFLRTPFIIVQEQVI